MQPGAGPRATDCQDRKACCTTERSLAVARCGEEDHLQMSRVRPATVFHVLASTSVDGYICSYRKGFRTVPWAGRRRPRCRLRGRQQALYTTHRLHTCMRAVLTGSAARCSDGLALLSRAVCPCACAWASRPMPGLESGSATQHEIPDPAPRARAGPIRGRVMVDDS